MYNLFPLFVVNYIRQTLGWRRLRGGIIGSIAVSSIHIRLIEVLFAVEIE
jgi:hypothetical protein